MLPAVGLTVAVAVFVSLMVARLVTPLMAAYVMRPHGHEAARDGAVMRGDLRAIGWIVRHRLVTLITGLGIFAGSPYLATQLPTGFIPAEDGARSAFVLDLPPGSALEDTADAADAAALRIRAMPEVGTVFVQGGTSPTGGLDVTAATLTVGYAPRAERSRSQSEFEAAIVSALRAVPGIRVTTVQGNGGWAFSLALVGEDGARVAAAAERLAGEVGTVSELANVTTTAALDRPELHVVPDAERAADLGVSPATIARTVRVATIGDVDQALPEFGAGDRRVPGRMEVDRRVRADPGPFRALRVPTAAGGTVPPGAVAEVHLGGGPATIERYDGERRVAVEADLAGGAPLGPAVAAASALPGAAHLPAGVAILPSGDAEIMADVLTAFGQALGAGVLMVYGVLVLLFGSFLLPVSILLTLPLSLGGAMIALWLTGEAMSLPVVIGILMLFGIATKNAIMLVDFAIRERARGRDPAEAIVEAGHKRARRRDDNHRHGGGHGAERPRPRRGGDFRAIAVIGGLVFSTFLSLLFTPAFYALVEGGGRSSRAGAAARGGPG